MVHLVQIPNCIGIIHFNRFSSYQRANRLGTVVIA